MSNSTTEYITQAIDPAVLSVLDVELDGKVVTAQDWKTLWQLVFNRINRIDAFCVKMEDIRVSLEQSRQEMIAAAHRVDVKYAALEKSFVHYGTEAPTNEHVKFWVQPVSNVPAYLFVTGAELNRQLDIQTDTMQEAYQQYVDDAVAAGKDVLQEYVDSHLEGVSDLVSDNQDDIRNLGERTAAVETSVETLKRTYVDTQRFEETSQGLEKRITYAESDIINLQEDIVIIKEDYVTKQYVDNAVASTDAVSQEYVDNAIGGLEDDVAYLSTHAATKQYVDDAIASGGGGGVSKEYVDNEIETLRHEVVTTDRIEPLEADVETIKQGYVTVEYVNEKTQNIPAIEEDIETLKDDAETFKENFEVISTSYATKKYVDDAIASSGGGTGGGGVSSWNELTDKPFYDEGTKTATLDYANPPAVGIDFGGVFLGKVTDDMLTADCINGAKLSLSFTADGTVTDVSQELNTDTITGISFSFGTGYIFDDEEYSAMIAVAEQTGEFDPFGDGNLLTITEAGTYLGFMHYSGATQNSMSLEYDTLKTLDIKFIPDSLYAEIDQRIENYISEALGGEY